MSTAYKIEDLPPHQGRLLTEEERRAFGPIEIQHGVPAKGFVTVLVPNEGSYSLYPERMNGDDPMCEIKTRVCTISIEEAFRVGELEDPEDEARRWQVKAGADFGSVWSQALAIDLLRALHERSFELTAESQLSEAGFSQTSYSPTTWRKDVKGGFFSYHDNTDGCWLMFEKNRATHWHNLLLLHYYTPLQDKDMAFPIFWPSTVIDPRRAAAGLAVLATELWSPDMLPQRGRKRSPSP